MSTSGRKSLELRLLQSSHFERYTLYSIFTGWQVCLCTMYNVHTFEQNTFITFFDPGGKDSGWQSLSGTPVKMTFSNHRVDEASKNLFPDEHPKFGNGTHCSLNNNLEKNGFNKGCQRERVRGRGRWETPTSLSSSKSEAFWRITVAGGEKRVGGGGLANLRSSTHPSSPAI